MDDIFEICLKEELKNPPSDPFTLYGLRPFDERSSSDLPNFFTNYKTEIGRLIKSTLSLSDEKPMTKIALIGPSGSGKTTLLRYFLSRLAESKRMPNYSETLKSIGFGSGFYAKHATKGLIDNFLKISKHDQGSVVVVDDVHEIFLKENKEVIESLFKMITDESSRNVIITTWLPAGWSFALTQHPELKNIFDQVIFVKGLDHQHCAELITKRFCQCSKRYTEDGNFTYDPFSEDAIKKLIAMCNPNPGMIVSVLNKSIEYAYQNKLASITEKDVEYVFRSMLGLEAYSKHFEALTNLQKDILNVALFATSMTTQEMTKITKYQRSNLSVYLKGLTNLGFLDKEKIGNEVMYNLKPVIRYLMEKNLMSDIEIMFAKK